MVHSRRVVTGLLAVVFLAVACSASDDAGVNDAVPEAGDVDASVDGSGGSVPGDPRDAGKGPSDVRDASRGPDADASDASCVPSCDPGAECGDDGCGGSCGTCTGNTACTGNKCKCVPTCDGVGCDDGCGWECPGVCTGNSYCFEDKCVCDLACNGKSCGGSDGCGGTCGCKAGEVCNAGQCQCVPDCAGKACGSDGCGGSCGSCAANEACVANQCQCVPQCTGKVCGDDGCGGSCGACGGGDACYVGIACRAPQPELVVTSLVVDPLPILGTTVNVIATVKNIGTAPAGPSQGYLSVGTSQMQAGVPALAPGASFSFHMPFTADVPIFFLCTAVADNSSAVNEIDETNNKTTMSLQFVKEPMPDVDLVIASLTHTQPALAGQPVTMTALVKNIGTKSAPPSEAMFRIGGGDNYVPVPSLPAGGTFAASYTFTWPNPISVVFWAMADGKNDIAEGNESNNTTNQNGFINIQ